MSKPICFVDFETAPDESRMHLFGLPPLEPYKETPLSELPSVADFLEWPIDKMKSSGLRPNAEWLVVARSTEASSSKSRKGALEAIDRLADMKGMYEREESERVKTLSVTPEFLRIVAIGWAVEDGDPESMVVGEKYGADGENEIDERDILDKFWELAARHVLSGYNFSGFDLPAVWARSAILRVRPSVRIDPTPWKSNVVDLFQARFPKGNHGKGPGGLKALAKLYNLVTEAEDTDGSQVYRLLKEGKIKEIGEYVRSDISLTQQLHELFSGLFC